MTATVLERPTGMSLQDLEGFHELTEVVEGSIDQIPEAHREKIKEVFSRLSVEGWANLQQFAYELVLDGRFRQKMPEDIQEFASWHDIELPVALLEWADTVGPEEFLTTMRDISRGRMEFVSASCPARAGFGFIIAGVVIGDAVITIISLATDANDNVVLDSSDTAAFKL